MNRVQKVEGMPKVNARRCRLVNFQFLKKEKVEENSFKECREKLMDQLLGTSQEEESSKQRRIESKLSSGEKLTGAELSYLRRNNPKLYARALRIQHKRESVLKKLENCRSKKEVEEVITFELGSISKKDPDKAVIIAAIKNVEKEFKETNQYQRLPEKEPKTDQRRGEDIWYFQREDGTTLAYSIGNGEYQETYGLDSEGCIGFNQEG